MTPNELFKIQKNSGLSVRQFSKQIHISHGDFYRILHGQKRINQRIEGNVLLWCEMNRGSTIDHIVDFFKKLFRRK